MPARALPFVICAALAAGCPGPKTGKPVFDPDDLASLDAKPDRDALREDLEMTIREAHRALSGGYEEAYLDGLSRDRSLIMIVLGPQALVGYDPAVCQLRRSFNERVEFVSKRLEVHVSADGGVGWSNDELSYRVFKGERRVLIPVRVTGVYERRAGKWLLVQEHMSYAKADAEAFADAAEGRAARPLAFEDYLSPGPVAKEVRAIVQKLIIDSDDTRVAHVSTDEGALLLGSDAERVIRDDEIGDVSTVRALYGYDTTVRSSDLRVKLSSTGNVAWAAANLAVTKDREEEGPVSLRVRATWVLERQTVEGTPTWRVVQTHVSLPICPRELKKRAFGEADPDADEGIEGCGDQVASAASPPAGAGGSAVVIAGSDK